MTTQRPGDTIPHQKATEAVIDKRLAQSGSDVETRVPGENPDCVFIGGWEDAALGDPDYGFLVTKVGNLVNANGYITGKALGAGATDFFLAVPDGWDGGAGTATIVLAGDNSMLGGIAPDTNGLSIALAPGVSMDDTDQAQINITWAIR